MNIVPHTTALSYNMYELMFILNKVFDKFNKCPKEFLGQYLNKEPE